MNIALGRLKKSELVWMCSNRCRHRHLYINHPQCYVDENPVKRVEGYIDIETSNLKADFGIIYCYCIKVRGKDKIYERCITEKELRNGLDREVVKQCIKDLESFDRTYGWYSARFDIPFIRTRALYHHLDFPAYGSRLHKDLYFVARRNIATHSRRLNVVAETVLGTTRKTRLDPKHWITAMSGNKKALRYILEHCRYDVLDLELVHDKLQPFYKESDTSI